MRKGIDRTFLHYGIRQEDMRLIEGACTTNEIDEDWLKEQILRPYQTEKSVSPTDTVEDRNVEKILKKALKQIV
jgi:hypothetical protein